MERGFFLSILSAFALALTAYPNDCRDIIGDTEPPPQGDISQTYPYGITYKTPPYISKIINEKGNAVHRIGLRVFQGCPTIEVSGNGRLWAAWFGSNLHAERARSLPDDKIFDYQPDNVNHLGQFSILATSEDFGKTWKEVYVFDPSPILNGSASDPLLWKDPEGKIRFVVARNMDVRDKDGVTTTTWEFKMENPDSENPGWTKPRLLCRDNASIMKPLILRDGSILRPGDRFSQMDNPDKQFFISEDIDGKINFVSTLHCPEASFAEQTLLQRKDGSIYALVRRKSQPPTGFESYDNGKTWKEVGFPLNVSSDTKSVFFRAKSGNIIYVCNDVSTELDKGGKKTIYHMENGKRKTVKSSRINMTAYISYDEGRTFPKKLLLDERYTSYPSVCEYGGFLYIAYDRGRGTYKAHEILLAKITEADIEAGKLVNKDSALKMEISSPFKYGGGVRKDDKYL